MTISLTGFMGCGKSSVGRRLSELLCCHFADLDTVIEQHAGKTIPEIFATYGEKGFREMEKDALSSFIMECPDKSVLALGGGAVMTPECRQLVHDRTICIYLRTSEDTLIERLTSETAGRPLLDGSDLRTRIRSLMAQRASTYEHTAHLTIDTDNKSIDRIAEEIIALI